jgi:uncharacterized protein with von Willebrand factor type A (vWA) domain
MGVQFLDAVKEIPNLSNYTTDEFFPDNFSDASQSMDELLDRNNSLGVDETFFETLDESALDEMAREVTGGKAFQEAKDDMPTLDSSSDGISSDGGMSGFMAGGAGLGLGKLKSFVLNKISSFRNMPEDNDDVGLDELLDLDDIRNSTYKAASESTRNGFGVANVQAGAAQSAA